MKNINRRSILKTTATLIGAATVGVTSRAMAGEPDAELLALLDEWHKQHQNLNDLLLKFGVAEKAAFAEYPQPPELIMANDCGVKRTLTRNEIEHFYSIPFGCPKQNKINCSKKIKALNAWLKQRRVIATKHRIREIEDDQTAVYDALEAIETRIMETPAQTIAGIFVKLTVWNDTNVNAFECERHINVGISALEDSKRLTDFGGPI